MNLCIRLFLIALFLGSSLQGQTYKSNQVETDLETFQQGVNENRFLVSQSASNTQNQVQGNLISIDQIGDANQVFIEAQADLSLINVSQRGENNTLYAEIDANQINQTVLQEGDNHNFTDFSTNSRIHNLEVVQQGNNQNLILYGGNGLSENMKIRMEGTTQSLVIRNFN